MFLQCKCHSSRHFNTGDACHCCTTRGAKYKAENVANSIFYEVIMRVVYVRQFVAMMLRWLLKCSKWFLVCCYIVAKAFCIVTGMFVCVLLVLHHWLSQDSSRRLCRCHVISTRDVK